MYCVGVLFVFAFLRRLTTLISNTQNQTALARSQIVGLLV